MNPARFPPLVLARIGGAIGLLGIAGSFSFGASIFPRGLAFCLPGELLISLWMATVGLDVGKWRAWAVLPAAA